MTADSKFRQKFKYYKQRQPEPCLDAVLDVNNPRHAQAFTEHAASLMLSPPELGDVKANPPECWRILASNCHPGFRIISGVLSPAHQLYWAHRCLAAFSRLPHRRNIDTVCPDIEDWFAEAMAAGATGGVCDKLRWATLGYHHNWDTKEYSEDDRSLFPADLADLSDLICRVLSQDRYRAEAAIVNFYPLGSTLSGHTDHSEHNLSAPLLSISLGQPAIFLLGGHSLDQEPVPYLLSSGDVAVMDGEARLCYHAVPRILTNTAPTEIYAACGDHLPPEERRFCIDYLANHRININVRQVN